MLSDARRDDRTTEITHHPFYAGNRLPVVPPKLPASFTTILITERLNLLANIFERRFIKSRISFG
jgi:hypothetical protein